MTVELEQWIAIGKIVAPQGLKGEVRVYPDTDFPERFIHPGERWLLRPGSLQPELVNLKSGRSLGSKGLYVVRLEGVDSIDQAELLRGAKLMVPVGDHPPLAPGEFHIMDLVGLTVIQGDTQELLGTVTGIAIAGNDLLEIELAKPPQQKILVPLVKEFVKSIDFKSGKLEILPISGLIPDH